MKIKFNDKRLSVIETNLAHKLGLPSEVVISTRRKLNFIRGAKDLRDLRNWKSLHLEKLKNNPDGEYSIRANKQWRIVFDIDGSCQPNEINITAIKDYH